MRGEVDKVLKVWRRERLITKKKELGIISLF